jgi:hypothetical protein
VRRLGVMLRISKRKHPGFGRELRSHARKSKGTPSAPHITQY